MSNDAGKHNSAYGAVISHREEAIKSGLKPIIGIDIGSKTIKIVQIKKNDKITKTVCETIPEGMLQHGRIEASTQLAEMIRRILKVNKIAGDHCALCLSGNDIIVRELKLPEMNQNQIMDNIKHELTSFLPLNHEEYCIDYKVLEFLPSQDGTAGKIRIMVAAVPNEIVNSYINTLKKAKLKVDYVDVIPNVAGKLAKRIMMNTSAGSQYKNIGFIDFGALTTNIILLKEGNYFIHKTIANGGEYLTSQIAEKLNIDPSEAEAYKKKTYFFSDDNNETLHVKNIIDYMITDIERTIDFFKNRNNQVGIDHLYLMGGGSLLKGLPAYMKEHLYIEVSYLTDLFEQLKKNDEVAVFPQAIGAALREE